MNLATKYAPPTFLKPCIVISTVFNNTLHETAVSFVEALNADHAMGRMYEKEEALNMKKSKFIPIKNHKTVDAAIKFHTNLAKKFINGGTQQEWEKGWKPYLKIYEKYCPF